jgi:arylformamidase
MRIYDVSLPVTPDLPVWPGDPPIRLKRVKSISGGANANVSELACGVHIGTHVDAPLHFIDGAGAVETMKLTALVGRARVVSFPKVEVIDAELLAAARIPPGARRILFKTRNSALWAAGTREFHKSFVALDESAARWLVRRKVVLVGMDYLSVAPFGRSRPTHRVLLEAGVAVVEGLNLTGIRPGSYGFACLPLKLIGSDGAPARAILTRP